MSFLIPIAFTYPVVLGALILLPVIWWLLRLTPPRPREVVFPPTRILLDIEKKEETPIRSPWWLTLLRLLLAAIVIVALAGPILRPATSTNFTGTDSIWVLIDNGWAASPIWDEQLEVAESLLNQAEGNGSPVMLAALADGPGQTMVPTDIQTAREKLRALSPRPWMSPVGELVEQLEQSAARVEPNAVFWLTSGLGGDEMDTFASILVGLTGNAMLNIFENSQPIFGLYMTENNADQMIVSGTRSQANLGISTNILAKDQRGLVIGQAPMQFNAGESKAAAQFELPIELRNEISRIEIENGETTGAVQLVDERWRRRSVGLLAGGSSDLSQPLLSPIYYLDKALLPFADIRAPRETDLVRAVPELIQQNLSVIMLADIGLIAEETRDELSNWVNDGGILVRFAGPRLASGGDGLLPVSLRTGDRELGGSLSWGKPQGLASFSDGSPFADLTVPEDIEIRRQVLAEPDVDLPDKTWASLTDGTPLVTADRFGSGWIVLFHVTADTSWSNLPISGTFVEMLQQIVAFSSAAGEGDDVEGEAGTAVLAPLKLLDGFGRLTSPSANVRPIETREFADITADREHPPGLYGSENSFRALNLLNSESSLVQFDMSVFSGNANIQSYAIEGPIDLRSILFVLALILLCTDALAVLFLSGGWRLPIFRGRTATLLLVVGLGVSIALPVHAQSEEAEFDANLAIRATTETRLAYVVTGNSTLDETSERGLIGLSRFLADRTALEPGNPIGVDIATDELSYFPLIYWPIDPSVQPPSNRTMARIDAFMRDGGTVLFDTRDEASAYGGSTGFAVSPSTAMLRRILNGLDIPPLEPVPSDHVLTKTFFLLQEFPGRWAGGPLWVEAQPDIDQIADRPVNTGDGVSPIVVTSNDFAAAWAIDNANRYMFPTYPPDQRQRELAFRTGVNIVMYTLTGNYKADQVHVPALLERLGQ